MTTTNYIWDEQNYLAEADETNTINVVYTNEPQQYGNLISTRLPISGTPTTFYHHFDALGSTRQLSKTAGAVSDTVTYDAWGNVVIRSGTTAVMLLWIGEVGYYFDPETGLVCVRARNYGPSIAFWAGHDPLLFVNGLNLYAYVQNSPVNFIDPSGLRPATQRCKVDCTGGCLAGRDAQVKEIVLDKLDLQKGSDKSCNLVTKDKVKEKLKELVDAANKKHAKKSWEYDFCSNDCECDTYKLPEKPVDVVLKDQMVEHTEKIPIIGNVHCIFKVTGKITMNAGALAVVGCVPKKKE